MLDKDLNRREFVKRSAALAVMSSWGATSAMAQQHDDLPFRISLAEWSLHRTLYDGKLDHLDFAKTAKETYGIEAIEYVNSFFKDKAKDRSYLQDLKQRAADHGVQSLLIMVDGEGNLGDADESLRTLAVESHYAWAEAAKFLGCHSIRVNAASSGSYEEQRDRAADGLRRLCEFAAAASPECHCGKPRRIVIERRLAGGSHAVRRSAQLRHTARFRKLPRQ